MQSLSEAIGDLLIWTRPSCAAEENTTPTGVSRMLEFSQTASRSASYQRLEITKQLVRRVLIGNGQCLIAVQSRSKAEEIAEELSKYIESAYFDPDLEKAAANARNGAAEREN